MNSKSHLSKIYIFLFAMSCMAESSLTRQVRAISGEAQGKVSVACSLVDCDLNPHAHPPMQSVFKLPLAMAVLHLVEQGSMTLEQPIRFLASDRILPTVYSPLQEKYPRGDVDVPLNELLKGSVSVSDNVAADILLRLIGGPKIVDNYVRSIGVEGFHIEDNEHALHADAQAQYRNWLEPAGAVQLLQLLNEKSPLSREHTALILEWMRTTPRTPKRIGGDLPEGTITMHKSGTSGQATNDIGLVVLPDGRRLAIAVFVTDSSADEAMRDKAIARIAKAAYDAAVGPKPLGQMVDVDGHRVHLYCTGHGSPTVMVVGAYSFDWDLVQPEIAKLTRICTYDVSGTAWSEAGKNSTCLERASEIHEMLRNAGVQRPYVFAGLSIGGLVSRFYARQYPGDVVAMVFVDHAFLPRSSRHVPSAPNAAGDSGPELIEETPILFTSEETSDFKKLPERIQNLHRWAEERQPKPATAATAEDCEGRLKNDSLGNMPLIVVSTGNNAPGYRELQQQLLGLSSNSRQMVAAQSFHSVEIDQPEVVIRAIRTAVTAAHF